ncbi:acyl-CoA thioesterase [Neobacillus drentensis]|uniref:acyl-CoA thioesterase n=1 Tax=Neobacillus drentensis TaxID=220684 RepID=UPI0008255381|nr:acyl-CoA thioesterase [Neobacillus drentensis]
MESVTEIIVKEDHIDPIGHVNNIKFVSFLEDARGDWYRKAGISYEEMQKKKIGTVILKLDIMFLKEARLGDSLKIITRPKKLGTKSFVFEQKIFNQLEEPITEVTVTSVMFDTILRRSITVVDEIVRKFSNID